MQQVIQNIRNGLLSVADIPAPMVRPGQVLIANACSLVSAGTEKMVMDLAKKSLLGKARERPDHVRRVLQKIRNEGVWNTLSQVRAKLDEPMTMGYSSAGVVLACGAGVQEFKPGDRVASNGPHAGVVCVPRHLCARAPDNVPFEQASFAVMGAIALQGVRLAGLQLGETAFVIGLGLLGQIVVALLRAQGCRVFGTDLDPAKCQLALGMGAEVARPSLSPGAIMDLTGGLGADAVIIAASTKSDGPVEIAGEAVRQKGRVVAVGAVGMNLPRRPYYFKEAEFVVSCSYGPGRYDPEYEERGRDYPPARVRWTEQRNMAAVLQLMGAGRLDLSALISHRFPVERALDAYELIEKGSQPYLGVILQFPEAQGEPARRVALRAPSEGQEGVGIGVLGAGNFARLVLLPAARKRGRLRPRLIVSAGGLSATHAGDRLGFEAAASDEAELWRDPDVKVVFALTRHDLHASQVVQAIESGRHVFVEKPLALTIEELAAVEEALLEAGERAPLVMVGFNRRFSPAARKVKAFFAAVRQPLTISIRFNAGAIPPEHWTQNEETGGGRIVGEACHAIDLAVYLAGSPVTRVFAESVGGGSPADDQCFITLRHANGSISSVAYLAGGDKAFPKERVEVMGGGRVAVIDDFRGVTTCAGGKMKTEKLSGQDKGFDAELEAFESAVLGQGEPPIPWAELRSTTIASILAVRSLREGVPFDVPESLDDAIEDAGIDAGTDEEE